ncbi:MAG: hypothetical protein M1824_003272 [Vezdaea acicularis]|nr:MAG: hypothetical protein M1824_003272 [Vezdaea acicularis]
MATRPLLRPSRPFLHRLYSTPPSTPPMLLKIRNDLKTALKTSNKSRLLVLRSLLASIIHKSKTASPITTDIQLLSHLRSLTAASRSAAQEFRAANREDLGAKEDAQRKVLEEYVGSVELVDEEDVRRGVKQVLDGIREKGEEVRFGAVVKACLGPGGVFEGRNVERGEVVRVVKEVVDGLG